MIALAPLSEEMVAGDRAVRAPVEVLREYMEMIPIVEFAT